MKILKFGGSSVSDAVRIKNIIEIIYTSTKKQKNLLGGFCIGWCNRFAD